MEKFRVNYQKLLLKYFFEGKTKDSSRNEHAQKRKGPYRALLEEDDDDLDLEMDYIRRPSMSDSADEM